MPKAKLDDCCKIILEGDLDEFTVLRDEQIGNNLPLTEYVAMNSAFIVDSLSAINNQLKSTNDTKTIKMLKEKVKEIVDESLEEFME